MRLRYTPRAHLDLSEIHDFIAKHNPAAAQRVISLIRKESLALVQNPAIGRPGRIEGTRELVVDRYPFIVAYSNDE